MERRKATIEVLVAGLALMLACVPQKNSIRLGPGPRADSLVFLLRTVADTSQPAESVYGLSVIRCDTKETMWTIAADGSRQIAGTVFYGKPVPGFAARVGPLPLTAGCYEVIATGAPTRRFDVGAEGLVRLRDSVAVKP